MHSFAEKLIIKEKQNEKFTRHIRSSDSSGCHVMGRGFAMFSRV